MDLKELQKHIDKVLKEQNYRSIPDFEGYSPFEMHQLLHFTFGADSPVKIQKVSESTCERIPIYNQIKYLADIIAKNGELKLTSRGFLPTRVVSELYDQGFMKDFSIEKGYVKLIKEMDSKTVNIARIIIELSELVKKRKGKLSLTKNGEKIIQDSFLLLKTIIETYTKKFNWAYSDGFGENQIGQLGYGFSLILMSKYGQEKRLDSFYAEKYFKAYPQLLDSMNSVYEPFKMYPAICYSVRTFNRFMDYFGLIKLEEECKGFDSVTYVSKTDLFDSLIKVKPHKK